VTPLSYLRARLRGAIDIEGKVRIGRGVRFDVASGGRVALERGCRVGSGSRFHVGAGARVVVGAGAVLGDRCVVAAQRSVEIGPGARLGDEVVLIDFDHDVSDVEKPVRLQSLLIAPVRIGAGAVLGPAATVLRGASVGANAVVEARAVVTHDVPDGAHARGVPARPTTSGLQKPR
jgi:acetyltransferase-like isoleucine patch superfamily enzyme